MSKKGKHNILRSNKGKRLNWKPLEKESPVNITEAMTQSRLITPVEIAIRQAQSYFGQPTTLLVP